MSTSSVAELSLIVVVSKYIQGLPIFTIYIYIIYIINIIIMNKFSIIIFPLLLSKRILPIDTTIDKRPLIGILTKPSTSLGEFVELDYIHFIESAGGVAVSISYLSTEVEMDNIFGHINGLLLTGGSYTVPQYHTAAKYLIDLALAKNTEGIKFPVFGICLGFHILQKVIGEDLGLLEDCNDCTDHNALLNFGSVDPLTTKMFALFDAGTINALKTIPLTYNYHSYMVTQSSYSGNHTLSAFFDVLATSESNDNSQTFVAAIEGKTYPFYGVQFHPEKANCDFRTSSVVVHSLQTTVISQNLANIFIQDARQVYIYIYIIFIEHKFSTSLGR